MLGAGGSGVTSISDRGLGVRSHTPGPWREPGYRPGAGRVNLRKPALTNEVVSILHPGETVQATGVTEDGAGGEFRTDRSGNADIGRPPSQPTGWRGVKDLTAL